MDSASIKRRHHSAKISNDDTEKNMKPLDLICLVCGAPATGFNFTVITCMCCKAFFRRNALFGLAAYQCRYLTEKCTINMRTRRDCSYCRLNKCFQVGMKKELILTEDIKRLKREKINANRQLTLTLVNQTNTLNEKESIHLRNISNAYEEYCRIPIITYEKNEYELVCHQPVKTRIKFQYYSESYQKHLTSLITFFRRLPEFEQFSNEEQQLLGAHNARFLMKINSVETVNDSFPIYGAVNFLLEVMYGKPLIEKLDSCIHQFKHHLGDSRCTQLFLIILLFSTYTNYSGHINTLLLYKIQEKYTQLLWTYLKQHYGELKACQKFSLLIQYCLHLQAICNMLEIMKKETQWQEHFISIQ